MYCSNCGSKIKNDDSFCSECGSAIIKEKESKREIVYEGEIHKCPHCGNPLNSFETICPWCNGELRGVKGSSAVKELSRKISSAKTDEEKIETIKNFPIANSREDIFEFMFLAVSNFDTAYYAQHKGETDVSDAWFAKIEQCYKKAKLMFSNQSDLDKIEKIYNEVIIEIKKEEKNLKTNKTMGVLMICVGCVLCTTQVTVFVGAPLLIIGIVKLCKKKKKPD